MWTDRGKCGIVVMLMGGFVLSRMDRRFLSIFFSFEVLLEHADRPLPKFTFLHSLGPELVDAIARDKFELIFLIRFLGLDFCEAESLMGEKLFVRVAICDLGPIL